MEAPTVVSLLWAAMGGVLTVWGRHRAVRSLWIAGACLLVAAAVKLVLVDFGSLGQLANILAVIAAGVVFLLVGWLAPMPPAAAPVAKPERALPTPRPVHHRRPAPAPAAASGGRLRAPLPKRKATVNEYQERNRAARHARFPMKRRIAPTSASPGPSPFSQRSSCRWSSAVARPAK